MEASPVVCVVQFWTKRICSSHPQPLLGKVKTVGQRCDFHGSSAAIPCTPSCGFVMRHILLTKGLLQTHSAIDSFRSPSLPWRPVHWSCSSFHAVSLVLLRTENSFFNLFLTLDIFSVLFPSVDSFICPALTK